MSQRAAFVLSAILTVLTLAGVVVGRDALLPGRAAFVDEEWTTDAAAAEPMAEVLVIDVIAAVTLPTATPRVVDIAAGAVRAGTTTASATTSAPAATATTSATRTAPTATAAGSGVVSIAAGAIGAAPTATATRGVSIAAGAIGADTAPSN